MGKTLKIHGTFEDVLRVAMSNPAKPKAKKAAPKKKAKAKRKK